MNSKLRLIIPLFLVVAFMVMGFSETSSKRILTNAGTRKTFLLNAVDSGDIAVGNRLTDSTGEMTIGSTDIQQSIVLTIPYLSGMSLSNPYLMVTPLTAYIILSGTDGSGSGVKVAIQVMSNDDSTLTYHPHERTLLHICINKSDCGNCHFTTLGNLIYNCQCGAQNPTDSLPPGCQNTTYWLR